MGEPKPLASLTSGLLARKGGARPAMRRHPLDSSPANPGSNGLDDLGWNDMGYDVDPLPSADLPSRVDIKSLLPGSMPSHDLNAEVAVDAARHQIAPESDFQSVRSLPWASDDFADAAAAVPKIVRQQKDLQHRVAAPRVKSQPEQAPKAPNAVISVGPVSKARRTASAASARQKAAFTLRLDAERHLRLRLASAVYNRSAQQILIEVLDQYLLELPEIDQMASGLPASSSHRKPTQNVVGEDQ